jgi:hypothetical protein
MTNYRKLKNEVHREAERDRTGRRRAKQRRDDARTKQRLGTAPTGLWLIETTGKPGVVHYAPEGTTDALCSTTPVTHWRTPPKRIRGYRLCRICRRRAPRWQADTARLRSQSDRAYALACPTCGARPEERCVDAITGRRRIMHRERWEQGGAA